MRHWSLLHNRCCTTALAVLHNGIRGAPPRHVGGHRRFRPTPHDRIAAQESASCTAQASRYSLRRRIKREGSVAKAVPKTEVGPTRVKHLCAFAFKRISGVLSLCSLLMELILPTEAKAYRVHSHFLPDRSSPVGMSTCRYEHQGRPDSSVCPHAAAQCHRQALMELNCTHNSCKKCTTYLCSNLVLRQLMR